MGSSLPVELLNKLVAARRALAAVLFLALCPGAHAADGPVVVGLQAQVLVDDYIVESMIGLTRRIQPLVKHAANPVLKPDRPWEERFAVPISAFYDAEQKLYRMWYRPGQGKFNLGYVTSADGITWDKPALKLVDFKGSRDNNQLALKTGPAWNGVLKDVRDPDPDRRYKLIAYNRATKSNGFYLFVSPDGLNWQPHSDKPLLEDLADCHTLMGWDESSQRYVAYVRPDRVIRTIARTTSADMVNWSPFETVLEPDEEDPPGTQFYGMSVFPDRGVYYGLLWVYHPNQLMVDVQLAFSRDGIKWQRAVRRHPLLSYGLPNQFDSHVLIALQPIVMGDELKVFYLAMDRPHAVVYPNEAYPALKASPPRSAQTWLQDRQGYTGLATCGRDRFVALEASSKPADLITKPFQLDGRHLRLNAEAPRGELNVEVQDANGQPIPGFSAKDWVAVRGDSIRHAVSWRAQKDLSTLTGRTVKLRIQLRTAKLYSFQIVP